MTAQVFQTLTDEFVINNIGEFISDVDKISKAVAKTTTVPILNGIHIEVRQNQSILTATNGSLFYSIKTETITAQTDFSIVIPPMVASIMKKLPEQKVLCSFEKQQLILKSGKSRFALSVHRGEDFPRMKPNAEKTFEISGKSLLQAFKGVAYAAGDNEVKPILQGILMAGQQEKLMFVSTDSKRMGICAVRISSSIEDEVNNIVFPKQFALDVIKNCEDTSDVVMGISDNHISVRIGNMVMGTRTMEGTYPDVSRIVPRAFKHECTINREELANAMERANLLKEEGSKAAIAVLKISSKGIPSLYISINNKSGRLNESLFVSDVVGDEVELGINALYVIEALKSMEAKQVRLLLNSSLEPIVIKPIGTDELEALILPIRFRK
ncbi:DNA polymerase III subunit beta [Aneurinibacillus thermoaerophilus]|uniref:DNA polymerase III subunit beta n=1 Tax=Aneurinibacillus thermoaerophilus TaxID=143495 RepID=UPI002E1FFFE1|nr:DNA polymerase III subunit beta [Aneurinibacillus thermoaerophilus]MED0738954.1 DNA polymerase III subunit beta [Aneurinibacillus thermoaerophilus]